MAAAKPCWQARWTVPIADADERREMAESGQDNVLYQAMKNCPVPEGPLYTDAEAKMQSHIRAEKGTTCHYYGRCRLANAYLYDPDIIARTARFLALDGRFDHTSVWLLGQRRWVYLRGCVESRAAAKALVQQVELIDDVEKVIDQLMVGEDGVPPYPTAFAAAKP